MRIISAYSSETESLIREFPLGEIDLTVWRDAFDVPESDPDMVRPYEVGEKQRVLVEGAIGARLDRGAFNYYVECFRSEE